MYPEYTIQQGKLTMLFEYENNYTQRWKQYTNKEN